MKMESNCYAEFLRYDYLVQTKVVDENDYQPEDLLDEPLEENHMLKVNYPIVIPLMSSKEKLKCRKILPVLKFPIPNRHTHPEEYCRSMLYLFFPFRNESELKDDHPGSYSQKQM